MEEIVTDVTAVFKICRADSGCIRFKVRYRFSDDTRHTATLALTGRSTPIEDIYRIRLGNPCIFGYKSVRHSGLCTTVEEMPFRLPEATSEVDFQEFCLTWYNGVIKLSRDENSAPYFQYEDKNITKNNIGHVKFYISQPQVEWIYEEPPEFPVPILELKAIEGGELKWKEFDGQLPTDAIIAGFENEPLYIAQAYHNRSLCPGKYVPSKRRAYVPWGGREHAKEEFKILCGYNAQWVATSGIRIPENAFVGGISEVNDQPLYIGRARIEDDLINGKVHLLYRTCYLPYRGIEKELGHYEILVRCMTTRGIHYESHESNANCLWETRSF